MIKKLMCLPVAAIAAVSLLATTASHGAGKNEIDVSKLPPAAAKAGLTYATDIKPIFDKSCVRCHGAEKPKARLRLDSLASALKGGESGLVILPGKGAQSKLVHSIAQVGDEDYFMPPPGNKAGIQRLNKEKVGLVLAWIDQGAK